MSSVAIANEAVTQPKKVCFVVNPAGGSGAASRRWPEVARALPRYYKDTRVCFTDKPMAAAGLARQALLDGYDMVVAVGGDGTVHEVVNGCMEGDQPVKPGAVLGVLPMGTGGDFRRSLSLPDKPLDALHALARAAVRPMDVGRVRFVDHQGQQAQRYYANIASFGSSGRIAHISNTQSKRLGGKLSFYIASVRGLVGWTDKKVRLAFDGGEPMELPITVVAVCNGRYFGGGMLVGPNARIDDGQFHVTIWSGFGLADFVTKSAKLYDGRHVAFPGTKIRACKTLRAEAAGEEEVQIEIDGEAPGRLPAAFEILPAALRVKTAA